MLIWTLSFSFEQYQPDIIYFPEVANGNVAWDSTKTFWWALLQLWVSVSIAATIKQAVQLEEEIILFRQKHGLGKFVLALVLQLSYLLDAYKLPF